MGMLFGMLYLLMISIAMSDLPCVFETIYSWLRIFPVDPVLAA